MHTQYKHCKIDRLSDIGGDSHRAVARFLTAAFAAASGVTLVAVGGPGGTGKSTFAQKLAEMLGTDRAVVLSLDSYKTPRNRRAEQNHLRPSPRRQ